MHENRQVCLKAVPQRRGGRPMAKTTAPAKTFMQRLLDAVEVAGNKVPHPAIIFLVLIGIVVVLVPPALPDGDQRHLSGRQPRDPRRGAGEQHGAQPAHRGRHPLHVHVGGAELHELQRGRRHHRGHGGRRRRGGIRAGQDAHQEAGAGLPAGRADLHPRLRRHRVEHRRRRGLSRADSARRRGVPQRGAASARRAWPHRSPVSRRRSASTC